MRYTNITLVEMEAALNSTPLNGQPHERFSPSQIPSSRECVYDETISENPEIVVRVYTSISKNSEEARRSGEDAIRVCAVNLTDRIGWIRTVRVLRVEGWRNNLARAIMNVRRQAQERIARIHNAQNANKINISIEAENQITSDTVGVLKWAQRKVVNTKQSSYYDHYFYKVPVVGTVDVHRIRTALSKRYTPTWNNFGGYTTLGEIVNNGDNTVTVEEVYHIGE